MIIKNCKVIHLDMIEDGSVLIEDGKILYAYNYDYAKRCY